jgi:hypothetical protein
MNYHQTPEEIIKSASPEQKILWNHIFLTFGERATISQLYIHGNIGTTELFTYVPRKIFLAYSLILGTNGPVTPNLAGEAFTIYDETNSLILFPANNSVYWDVTAAAVKFLGNSTILNNLYFSKINTTAGAVLVKFIGYRITF